MKEDLQYLTRRQTNATYLRLTTLEPRHEKETKLNGERMGQSTTHQQLLNSYTSSPTCMHVYPCAYLAAVVCGECIARGLDAWLRCGGAVVEVVPRCAQLALGQSQKVRPSRGQTRSSSGVSHVLPPCEIDILTHAT